MHRDGNAQKPRPTAGKIFMTKSLERAWYGTKETNAQNVFKQKNG